ncbi:SAM-dependent methyltransferase [Thozetella sp. PMI_491]|nr:SAM-dependent methyltransferase [Thozetella sp. PMI_491]
MGSFKLPSEVRYSELIWNAPLSEPHAENLLTQLDLGGAKDIVDLGCGWGELLIRAAARSPRGAIAGGVDTDDSLLERGRREAKNRQVEVVFSQQNAQDWIGRANRVICIGASHSLGGSVAMMRRLAEVVQSGVALVGDAVWTQEPTKAALEAFQEVVSLAELIAAARDAGWTVMHVSIADQSEWDEFESLHRAGPRKWLAQNLNHPRAPEVRREVDSRERFYSDTQRGVLGFAYLVLAR